MGFRSAATRFGRTAPPTIVPETIPAPVGGMNSLSSLVNMPVTDCVYTYNLMPAEYGMRLRKGYREWAINCPSEVRTVVPYDNQSGDNAKDRLFACCAEGIYDVSLFNTQAPAQVQPFTSNGIRAGFGVTVNFTTDAAELLLLYADEENGIYQYDGDTQTWSRPAITNADPTKIAFVNAHKQRVWVIEQGSSDAWYLPVDAVAGAATKFNFGSKFIHGGRLMGIFSWTVDGGDGVDDLLVAVSRAGDVLVYRGGDPSQPDWSLVGSYFIGETPDSRRISAENGAELYLLSTYGLISVRDLLKGVYIGEVSYGPAAKIARLLRNDVLTFKDSPEWQLTVHPADSFLQVITPLEPNYPAIQYNMHLTTQSWGWWRGVPILSAATWRGDYFIGSEGGTVYQYDGTNDNVTLAGDTGIAVEFSILSAYQPYGAHAHNVKASLIRPFGIITGITAVNIKAMFDYEITETILSPAQAPAQGGSVWDTALWDAAVWDFVPTAVTATFGAAGEGRAMAIAMRGYAQSRVTLIGWDVLHQQGGPL